MFSLSSECGYGCLIKRYPPPFRETFGFKKNLYFVSNQHYYLCLPSPTGSLIAPQIPQLVITAAARWGLGGTPIASVLAFINLPEVSHLLIFLNIYIFHELMSSKQQRRESSQCYPLAAVLCLVFGVMLMEEGEG